MGRIEKSKYADCAVEDKSACTLSGPLEFDLEDIVYEPHRKSDVVKEVFNSNTNRFRSDKSITTGNGFKKFKVKEIIKGKNAPVEPFQGVTYLRY